MNRTFHLCVGEPRQIATDKCRHWVHVFLPSSETCACGTRTFEEEREDSLNRFCECGMAAVKFSRGSPICERCDRIEREVLYADNRDQVKR